MRHFGIDVSNIDRARGLCAGMFGRDFAPKPGAEEAGQNLVTGLDIRGAACVEDGQGTVVGMITPVEDN